MANQEPRLLYVGGAPIPICEACLDGEGGECHTAGCLFWINRAPDIPIREKLEDYGAVIATAGECRSAWPRATHEQLIAVLQNRPSDFEPYGDRPDDERGGDCSCGCIYFHELERPSGDWGVCFNPDSPRAGLLTFEHQGCPQYDGGPDDEEEDDEQDHETD